MEAVVIEKPDDTAATPAPMHRMAKELKLRLGLAQNMGSTFGSLYSCIRLTMRGDLPRRSVDK